MKSTSKVIAAAVSALFSLGALAQDQTIELIERNARQQERIEQGLRSGDLTVREAARLEREAAHIERAQSRALRDGQLSPDEYRRIDHAQDGLGEHIRRERHDAQFGDPSSRPAQRMADAVDRSGNQQRRIADGLRSGELTHREVARLERGQAHVNRMQGHAGADGHYGRHENRHVQHAENRQSRHIWRQKHDEQVAGDDRRGSERHAGSHDRTPSADANRSSSQRSANGERGRRQFERHAQR